MKRVLYFLVSCLTILVAGSISVSAQAAEISASKRTLIAEIISVTKADKQLESAMRSAFRQLDESYPQMVSDVIGRSTSDLTPAQKKSITAKLLAQHAQEATLADQLFRELNFREFIEKTYYPLYDKYFSEAELSDLLQFYKSPTGQKVNEVMPALFADSIKSAQTVLTPKITEIIDRKVKSDIGNAQKALDKKPK